MAHKTFYLRAPDQSSLLTDLKNAFQDAGVDPYKKALYVDNEGNDRVSPSLGSVFPAGSWRDNQGNPGNHCLLTARTDDPVLKDLIQQFDAADPKLGPSEVSESNKQSNGTSRINPPATPIRPISTV